MDALIALAGRLDGVDLAIGALLEHFRDEHVPLSLSLAIAATAAALLALLIVWGGVATVRLHRLRRRLARCGRGASFRENFPEANDLLGASLFAGAWAEYRECLRDDAAGMLYSRRPDEYFGLHAIASRSFPARFFAASHGYFIGIGLLLTFVGLVAALKFAASGVSSPDLVVAKDALNALLAAASFKFMTSIAGLGCSLILSVAARSVSYAVEGAARRVAVTLERAMRPIVTECLAFDQLAATRAQLASMTEIGSALRCAATNSDRGDANNAALQQMLASFLTEMKSSAAGEMKQLTGRLSDVGSAIGQMQNHIGASGEQFASQLGLAASRLLDAATALQTSLDGRVERVGARIEAMASTVAQGEAMVSRAAEKAASGLVDGFAAFDASLRSQLGSMQGIVGALDRARQALDGSAQSWTASAAPVLASVDASRQIASELGLVADRVGTSQREMAEMAKAIAQLSEKVGAVWTNYSSRFEQIDDDLSAAFAQLQGGTRAFGEEFMKFVGKLDHSLANGMQAFSIGTEELREVVQLLVDNGQATAPATAEAA